MYEKETMILPEERKILRELALKQAEYAALPEQKEKEKLWYRHNALQSERPVVVVEMGSFEKELLPRARCTSPLAAHMEHLMNRQIVSYERIGDDKVVPSVLNIDMQIFHRAFDMDFRRIVPKEKSETMQGFQFDHPIRNLEEDFHKLRHSVFGYDAELNRARLEAARDAVGDILPVGMKNHSIEWSGAITATAVNLMGLEELLVNLAAAPELAEKLLDFIVTDLEMQIDWMEELGILTANNGNDFAGAGSYGFTKELNPAEGKVRPKDMWFNTNSQESSSISPRMYGEQIFPFIKRLASRFGLIYYGCCEPVHAVWKDYVSTIPNLRKVSVSMWCDEDYMGEALKGSGVIYSRKPSPLLIGTKDPFDEDAFRAHIRKTLVAAKGCGIEFIYRDVYTLGGDTSKPARAVKIIREMIGG